MNGTTPQLRSAAMRRRFQNWETGFDLYEEGRPVQHCHTSNAHETNSRIEGWNAAKCVAELAADTQAMLVFTRAKKKFNGMILL